VALEIKEVLKVRKLMVSDIGDQGGAEGQKVDGEYAE
jgi:hypothetical protein